MSTLVADADPAAVQSVTTAGIRVVAPRWVGVSLPIGRKLFSGGKLPQGEVDVTIGRGLLLLGSFDEARGADAGVHRRTALPSYQWWIHQLESGRLHPIAASDKVCPDTVLVGRFHYHEQSIAAQPPLEIVFEDEQFIVVNKPAGVDVLANPDAGRVANSLTGLLAEHFCAGGGGAASPLPPLPKPAHRLDAPVSGLVCCGRTSADVRRLQRQIAARRVEKRYLARVRCVGGRAAFPPLPLTIDAPLAFDSGRCFEFMSGEARCLGAVVGQGEGKEATTVVEECWGWVAGGGGGREGGGDDETAVVVLRIVTGRKHQIRCHLQHAGLPIANDTRYGGAEVHAPPSAFGLPVPPPALARLLRAGFVAGCEACAFARDLLAAAAEGEDAVGGPRVCGAIWLHSWRYAFPELGLRFEAPTPSWARVEGVRGPGGSVFKDGDGAECDQHGAGRDSARGAAAGAARQPGEPAAGTRETDESARGRESSSGMNTRAM